MSLLLQATPSQTSSWLVQTGLPLLVAFVGVFMGFVFVVAAWKGSPSRTVDLKKDSRVKGFLYGLGGFLTMLIADWKTLLGTSVDKSQLLILYGFPFVFTAFGGVLLIAFGIWLNFAWRRRNHPHDSVGEPLHLALDYLLYGYSYHREEYQRLLAAARESKQKDRFDRLRSLWGDVSTNLAATMLSPTASVQDVLRNMCSIVKAHSEGVSVPEMNASLMVAIPFDQATEPQKSKLKFTFGDNKRYGHLLLVTDYAYDKGEPHIALPVEDPNRTADWIDWTLVGAPEAFLRNSETVVNTKRLDFAPKIPETIRRQIRQYFKGKKFKSFACLTVIGKGSLIGIVNIESNQELGSDEIQNEIAKLLQPFCAVLSLILRKEGPIHE
jgi:hypothetical protein